MKTDKDKLTELLTSFGVEWREKPQGIQLGGYRDYEKVTGYKGFFTLFEFYSDGSFMQMGAWE